ncbi:MAG TPA: beta-L-arabinofuranosidase domain-containing protein [Chitinophaga sp.]|uniref:glycoside hydrolase family 127 protein n=1 Tax=Chitinophaga sp. TaxID=1869181 RepID=UPI002DB883FC|nr:beta-L-arabinofuranosidase domain-containing protein [Chitinophaga sp.]HEU4551439.1 beta-L-arabinofuranosidase domain-containing protein [Chitinophaga sp.]
MPILCSARQQPGNRDALWLSGTVALKGRMLDKMSGALQNRIMAQDVDRLIAPFKPENRKETRLWQGEFWGKWFTSAVLAYRVLPDPRLKEILAAADAKLLHTQTADGYIGNYAPDHRLEQWDIWDSKYCMLGLLDYYNLTGDQKSLRGAARLADNVIAELHKGDGLIVNKGNYRGMAASSILEPVCLLYNATHEKKYLDFAKQIVEQWERLAGPQLISKAAVNVAERFPVPKNWYSPEQGQKAYEMMSCYEGLLELYRVTGEQKYKDAVMKTWENIYNTEINIAGSGASTEMWFGGKAIQNLPVNHYQETCVTVTWLKLSQQLLRLTGDAKYADAVECTFYNALLGSMNHNGADWAKYTPLNGQRLPGSEQCGMGLNCCVASGPRGLFNFPLHMVMQSDHGIYLNYYAAGAFALATPSGQQIIIDESTAYPKSGEIAFTVDVKQPEDMEIAVRIPGWSKESRVMLNGRELEDVHAGAYLKIKRRWTKGDKIMLALDMRGRVIKMHNSLSSAAIMRGPLVLARDSRFEGAGIYRVLKPVETTPGYISLVADSAENHAYLAMKAKFIPESYTEAAHGPIEITLCDYASAGNMANDEFYQVWMPQLVNRREEGY